MLQSPCLITVRTAKSGAEMSKTKHCEKDLSSKQISAFQKSLIGSFLEFTFVILTF